MLNKIVGLITFYEWERNRLYDIKEELLAQEDEDTTLYLMRQVEYDKVCLFLDHLKSLLND